MWEFEVTWKFFAPNLHVLIGATSHPQQLSASFQTEIQPKVNVKLMLVMLDLTSQYSPFRMHILKKSLPS